MYLYVTMNLISSQIIWQHDALYSDFNEIGVHSTYVILLQCIDVFNSYWLIG